MTKKMLNKLLTASAPLLVTLFFTACTATDTRQSLLTAAKSQDPHFPNGTDVILTRFAHIGEVSAQGRHLRVVHASSVIPNMPAPRGDSWLYLFEKNQLITRWPIDAFPLWCDGSKIYFFGIQTDGLTEGNAIDLNTGLDRPQYIFIPAPGSWLPPQSD